MLPFFIISLCIPEKHTHFMKAESEHIDHDKRARKMKNAIEFRVWLSTASIYSSIRCIVQLRFCLGKNIWVFHAGHFNASQMWQMSMFSRMKPTWIKAIIESIWPTGIGRSRFCSVHTMIEHILRTPNPFLLFCNRHSMHCTRIPAHTHTHRKRGVQQDAQTLDHLLSIQVSR